MLRKSNASIPQLLQSNEWPLDKEYILLTGGFGELWIFAQFVDAILREPQRVIILSADAYKVLELFTDPEVLRNQSIILKDASHITKLEAFVVQHSVSYGHQYFSGKSFVADIRCSSAVHYPHLCRAMHAGWLPYENLLKLIFELEIDSSPMRPNLDLTNRKAKSLLGAALSDSEKPICLLFAVNVTHQSLSFAATEKLVELIEEELKLTVLINVTLKANANTHGLSDSVKLVNQIRKSPLGSKCIEIEGYLLASVGCLIDLAIGVNGGGMDVVKYFGTADVLFIHSPHKWEAGSESNKHRENHEYNVSRMTGVSGAFRKDNNFSSETRGVYWYSPVKSMQLTANDLTNAINHYRDHYILDKPT